MDILVTGGCGFVGSNLALLFKAHRANARVVALDNLRRRGSELALSRLRAGGVEFHHGDIRNAADLEEVGPFDVLLECSAEPSVHAGYGGSPRYVIDTNLMGTVHCLEAARRHRADVVFLSTSRVYPIEGLRQLPLVEDGNRFAVPAEQRGTGWSSSGITTDFPLRGQRSMYGATKLCSELLLEEYAALYGVRTIVNRCGVLAGPWQMGKVDQGFVVLWAARHLYGGTLGYIGYGGRGLQVRDVLHVDDLYELVAAQLARLSELNGRVFNVGGGAARTTSLAELTEACAARTRPMAIGSDPQTRAADIPWYVTDNTEVSAATGWAPRTSFADTLGQVFTWLVAERHQLEPILGRG
jgi:CDP-paratose 2-epimerase